jgi:hypothetical protein
MKKRMLVAVLVAAALSAVVLSAQSAAGGMRYVMKMELRQVSGGEAQPANPMTAMVADTFKKMVLPEGAVEMEFVTDGQSVRTEMRGQMSMLAKGSVVLYAAGQTDGYVLNPTEKTYYVLKTPQMPALPAGMTLPKPEISVKPSGTFETIVGHRAEKVNISWRMPIPIPEGVEVPPGTPTEFSMDIENWCTTDLKMPASATRLMGSVAQSMPGFGLDELAKACPFALRSRMRMSMMPGYEILSTVTSASDASPSPDLFKLPAGYKEVPPPTPKMPGIGGQQ